MISSDLQFFARDADYNLTGVIDEWVSVTLNIRFNALSAWLITVPADHESAALLAAPGAGFLATLHGRTILSGPVYTPSRDFGPSTPSMPMTPGSHISVNLFTAGGPDDTTIMRSTVVEPCAPPYILQASDDQTGPASTVMSYYVNANCGPGARLGRVNPALTLAADPGIGATVSVGGRFEVLGDDLDTLALASGLDLGWECVQTFGFPQLVFSVYQPKDLTVTSKFSVDLGNMVQFHYDQVAPKANAIIAGGAGDGTSRLFLELDDQASIDQWGRIEEFLNATTATTTDQLMTAAQAELLKQAQVSKIAFIPLDTPGLTFGIDYNVGDQVTAIIDGVATTDIIREVDIVAQSIQSTGGPMGPVVQVTPIIGTPGVTNVSAIFKNLAANTRAAGVLGRV